MTDDGRHGFDFWQGTWHGRNRKLVDVSDPECQEWIEFDGVCEARSALGGLGNLETFLAENMPGRGRVVDADGTQCDIACLRRKAMSHCVPTDGDPTPEAHDGSPRPTRSRVRI